MGVGENWLTTGYILKVELKGFADVLEVWGVREREESWMSLSFIPEHLK